jgi:Putative type VII ESX secretion system translocon, EccE
MVRRIRRSTVVFVEVVLAVIVAGVAVGIARHSVLGYALAGLAALVGVAVLVRPGGRGLVDLAVDRLRDPAPADGAEADPGLGSAARLLPLLHVTEVHTRDGTGIGVAGDGQGFVVVLDAGLTPPPSWALARLVEILVDDPARPAAVQVLVEQGGLGAEPDPRFGPGRTYRALPVGGLPLWNRVLLAIRHEPAWAPETVESRGGGAVGAHNALAAVAARTVARAARDGIRLRPVDAAELAVLLRDLGPEPDPDDEADAETDVVLSVPLARENVIEELLPALAALDVARSVLAVTASAVDHSLCAVVRLTDGHGDVAEQAARLLADGLVTALPRAVHDDGVLATLPLGGGARALEGVVEGRR